MKYSCVQLHRLQNNARPSEISWANQTSSEEVITTSKKCNWWDWNWFSAQLRTNYYYAEFITSGRSRDYATYWCGFGRISTISPFLCNSACLTWASREWLWSSWKQSTCMPGTRAPLSERRNGPGWGNCRRSRACPCRSTRTGACQCRVSVVVGEWGGSLTTYSKSIILQV